MRVLLTGTRAPVTLDLARRFSAANHTVFAIDTFRFPLAGSSRAIGRMLRTPGPKTSTQTYLANLRQAIQNWKIDLLIPTCEEVFYIASALGTFADLCRVFTEPIEKLERFHNKWKFSQAIDSPYVKAPQSHFLSDQRHLEPFLSESTAWVFKPVYSRFAAETQIGLRTAEAAKLLPTPTNPWLAQRRILGREYSSYSVACEGRLAAHALYHSPYKVGVGSGIYFVPCRHEAIENFVREFVEAEHYTGQIGFDFLEDPDGQTWVLEANPRATSGVHVFGEQDPLVECFFGTEPECVRPSKDEPRMLGMAMTLFGLGQAIRRREPWKFVKDFWRARDVVFEWSDPLPAVLMPLSFGEILVTALRNRCGLTQATTFDIEWNGELR